MIITKRDHRDYFEYSVYRPKGIIMLRQRVLASINALLTPALDQLPRLDRDAIATAADVHVQTVGTPETLVYTPPQTIHKTLPPAFAQMIGQSWTFPAPAILTVDNATLLGRDAVVMTSAGNLLMASLYDHLPYLETVQYQRLSRTQTPREMWHSLTHTPTFDRIATAVMLYSAGYFHWMMEQLPRLWLLREYDPHLPLLMPPQAPAWMHETLSLLGLTGTRIDWTYTRAQAKTLVYPTPIHGTGIPSPRLLRAISQHMKTHIAPTRTFATPRIYISRRHDARRRVVNEAEILPQLQARGFVAYDLRDLTFSEQVQLFDQAEIIVGAHGAGFVNAMHSTDTTLIEFFEPTYLNTCYYRLACGMGFGYGVLIGQSADEHIYVPPTALEQILARFD